MGVLLNDMAAEVMKHQWWTKGKYHAESADQRTIWNATKDEQLLSPIRRVGAGNRGVIIHSKHAVIANADPR